MSAPKPDKLNRIVKLLMTRVMTKECTLGYDEQVPHNNQIQEEISPHCNKHKKSETSSMYDDDEAPEDGDSKSIDAHNFKGENKSNSSASDLSCLSVIAKQPNSPKGKTLHKCKYCTKVFSRKSDNIKHERVHTGERPFLCRVCKKAFTQKAACVRHERLHNYDRPFICQFCGNGFIQRWDLVLHERIHTGEKLFDCHFCKMIFTQKKTLERHERIHTNERPFQCHYCGQGFTQSSTLVKHERIHTGEKPYTCKYCGRKFASNSDCGRHERIHARKVQNKQSNLSSLPDIQANAVNTVVGQNNGDAKQDKNFPKSFIKSTAEMTSVVKQVNPGDVVEKKRDLQFL
ncbi:zinc finger protein OZF [Lingula anatina]|uniref:Zinc finger protein OZF n=1 Tax=Lingula anatina TaxID=7574 RepID=A0A1S3KCR2_LINAN|nr:zinc finger protein OZF [Lingula anatina]|eukprot:XP_013420418.1 zinc finger protein OZF [Lingula anatina]